jgi:hypothetical protein
VCGGTNPSRSAAARRATAPAPAPARPTHQSSARWRAAAALRIAIAHALGDIVDRQPRDARQQVAVNHRLGPRHAACAVRQCRGAELVEERTQRTARRCDVAIRVTRSSHQQSHRNVLPHVEINRAPAFAHLLLRRASRAQCQYSPMPCCHSSLLCFQKIAFQNLVHSNFTVENF